MNIVKDEANVYVFVYSHMYIYLHICILGTWIPMAILMKKKGISNIMQEIYHEEDNNLQAKL